MLSLPGMIVIQPWFLSFPESLNSIRGKSPINVPNRSLLRVALPPANRQAKRFGRILVDVTGMSPSLSNSNSRAFFVAVHPRSPRGSSADPIRLSSSQASSRDKLFELRDRPRRDFLRRVTRAEHEPCYLRTCRVTSLTNNGPDTEPVLPFAPSPLCDPRRSRISLPRLLLFSPRHPFLRPFLPPASRPKRRLFTLRRRASYVRTDAACRAKNGPAAA